MELSTEERNRIQDFVWGNNAHKEKKAAVQAAAIKYADKIGTTNGDMLAFCELCRLPKAWKAEVVHCLLVAEKIKQLTPRVTKK